MKAKFISDKEYKKGLKDLEKTFEKEEPKERKEEWFLETYGENPKEAFWEVYESIMNVLEYYMDLEEDVKNIVTLWIMGTHFHDKFNTYPYLFLNAMKGSGKSRLCRIIEAFSWQGFWTMAPTEAVLFRSKGTLCIDEAEGIGSKEKASLRELLNSGYKKGMKIFRNTKKKSADGESFVIEEFETYRPVVLANINGIEEVLGDRCIPIRLEKSMDASKIKLVENFEELNYTNYTRNMTNLLVKCSLCMYVGKKNINKSWNDFVKMNTTLNTSITLSTQTTQTTQQHKIININMENLRKINTDTDFYLEQEKEDEDWRMSPIFKKINDAGIEGRYLELFMPLFLMGAEVSDKILERTITYAKSVVDEKKVDEVAESRDVLVYSLVAKQDSNNYTQIKNLTTAFRLSIGEENEWVNSQWLGRALTRLKLTKEKRRTGQGIEVILEVEKAKRKERMFRPTPKEDDKK